MDLLTNLLMDLQSEKTATVNKMASTNTLKLLKSMYWIITVGIHLYLTYILFSIGHAITGTLWLVLGLMIIYLVYPVYFPAGDPGSQWPPYITACPDYLTLSTTSGNPMCYDFVGLNSKLQYTDPSISPLPTDPAHAFNPAGSAQQKAAAAQSMGLTWEGIY
jgi:hypothetical protein